MAKEYFLTNTVTADAYRHGYIRLSIEMQAKENTPSWATVLKSTWQQLDPFDVESDWRYLVIYTLGED